MRPRAKWPPLSTLLTTDYRTATMPYCLDTNIIVFCLRGKSAKAMKRIQSMPAEGLSVPMQVMAELHVGAAKSAKPTGNRAAVDAFVMPFSIVWPDRLIAEHYASIRCAFEAIGKCISEADLWIAATARSRGDVVVTNNVNEFSRVPGLAVENWSR